MLIEDISKRSEETTEEYIDRICRDRKKYGITWFSVADIINSETGLSYTESYYRKNYKKKLIKELAEHEEVSYDEGECDAEATSSEVDMKLLELKKRQMKISDERTQVNAILRRLSREETIKDIAHDFALQMNMKGELESHGKEYIYSDSCGNKSAILEISDWHYGLVCDNYWNKYDTDIAKERIRSLLNQVILRCKENSVRDIHVVNLADLIAGRIHLTLRLQSRIDVITQTMEVSELLAQFLNELSKYFCVHYYDCLDNHSRLEPNKSDSLDMETLVRITPWYLKERCKNINIHENAFGADIINFSVNGHEVLGVHGDKDKPSDVVDNLTLMTHKHYELVLTAHRHHFSCDEKNETVVVSNGSLMGTDSYAEKLRLSSKPSQNLIFVTEQNVIDSIHRILV